MLQLFRKKINKSTEDKDLEENKGVTVSLLVPTNRPEWMPWLSMQINKIIRVLRTHGIKYETHILADAQNDIEKLKYRENVKIDLYTKPGEVSEEGCYSRGTTFLHFTEDRMTIGEKRNMLCMFAQNEYMVNIDDDNWQAPYRVLYQIIMMREKGFDCSRQKFAHSANIDNGRYFVCSASSESSYIYTKKFWSKQRWGSVQVQERTEFIKDREDQILNLKGLNVEILLNHDKNTCKRNAFRILGNLYDYSHLTEDEKAWLIKKSGNPVLGKLYVLD